MHKLLKLLPQVFPPQNPESTFLFHDDLNMQSIIINEHGAINALDWECVSMAPL